MGCVVVGLPVLSHGSRCPKCGERGDEIMRVIRYVSPVDNATISYPYRYYYHGHGRAVLRRCYIGKM